MPVCLWLLSVMKPELEAAFQYLELCAHISMSFINKIRKNVDIQMASYFKLLCCASLAGTVVPVFGYSLSCESSNRPCYSFANIQTVVPI